MAKKRSTKSNRKKRSLIQQWFLSKGSITFKVLLAVIIIGSVALVSGIFPQSQITPLDPDAPKVRPVIDKDNINQDSLQLRSIGFESCSQTAAVNMLLDISNSMNSRAPDGETKIKKLQDSTVLFSQNFTDDSVIGIQTFNSSCTTYIPDLKQPVPIQLFSGVSGSIESTIRGIQATGCTPTSSALSYSLEQLRPALNTYPDRNFSLIFVSDGEPVPDSQNPQDNSPDPSQEIKNLGVTIYSIGIMTPEQIRDGSMKQLLEHIASTPDKAHIAPDGTQLTEIYNQIGTDLCQAAG